MKKMLYIIVALLLITGLSGCNSSQNTQQNNYSDLQQKYTQLQSDYNDLKSQVTQLKSSNNNLNSEIMQLQSSLSDLQTQVNNVPMQATPTTDLSTRIQGKWVCKSMIYINGFANPQWVGDQIIFFANGTCQGDWLTDAQGGPPTSWEYSNPNYIRLTDDFSYYETCEVELVNNELHVTCVNSSDDVYIGATSVWERSN